MNNWEKNSNKGNKKVCSQKLLIKIILILTIQCKYKKCNNNSDNNFLCNLTN